MFLEELRTLGVILWVTPEGRLAFDAPRGVLDDTLLSRMKADRDQLLTQIIESKPHVRVDDPSVRAEQEGPEDNFAGSLELFDGEPFDEELLAAVPECFECGRLCDRVNGLGLWYCGTCDPLTALREQKTRDALKTKKRWEEKSTQSPRAAEHFMDES